ncbi:hypothetical protein EVAR_96537_1 [Eumeta japonica]|uniref:Uncharacterized protein n=1 Tax=Eumeta variegata TaxID=151549 RepID=A0A4C1WFQ4_EUMVA|nr:hypothetical protein EVAR_96537_1 [Eumeta japonica]
MRSSSRSQWQTIYACKTREITKIAIGIWSMNLRERSLGAETVRGLGVQTVRLTGVYHRGERKRGITVTARCTLRGIKHARSPTLRKAGRRNTAHSNTKLNRWSRRLDRRRPIATARQPDLTL